MTSESQHWRQCVKYKLLVWFLCMAYCRTPPPPLQEVDELHPKDKYKCWYFWVKYICSGISERSCGLVPVRLRDRAGALRQSATGDHLQQWCRGGESHTFLSDLFISHAGSSVTDSHTCSSATHVYQPHMSISHTCSSVTQVLQPHMFYGPFRNICSSVA